MLLLSSATRIFGTTRPPAILHRTSLSGCTAAARVPAFILLEHSRACASITPRWDCVANQYYPIAHYFWGIPTGENNKGCSLFAAPRFTSELLQAAESAYQGMIFFS